MGVELACRCGVRLHFSHAGWARRCPHCGEDLSHPGAAVRPGDSTVRIGPEELAAKEDEPPRRPLAHFDLVRLLGRGGMGFVYLAYDTSLDREVAVKTLAPELAGDAAVLSRFYNEARAGARIHHANVVAIYHVGCDQGQPYFAMEYVEGKTLADRLDRGERLAPHEALEVVLAAAKGLAAAHRRGIVHRDVKPSNLLLAEDGTVKIADFGLAKSLAIDSELSTPGTILGTPAYMSPEQAAGKAVDHRSDVYSLGVTFYHLLAGRRPFDDRTPVRLLAAHLEREPEAVERLAPDCPPRIARVVRRMMEKDQAGRPQTYDALLAALEACRPRPRVSAGLWSRSWAFAVDAVLLLGVGVLTLVAGMVLVRLQGRVLPPDSVARLLGYEDRSWRPAVAGLELLGSLLVVTYFAVGHARWGASIGKRLLGLEVLDRWGERLGWGRAIGRAALLALVTTDLDQILGTGVALRWIGPTLLLANAVAVVWKKRAIHDLLAGTQVVFRR